MTSPQTAPAAQPSHQHRQPNDTLVRQQVGVALRAGDSGEAERLLRARIGQIPNDVEAMAALADVLAQSRRVQEATALLHRALGIAPTAHGIRLHLSLLHQEQSHFPMALSLLQQVPSELRQSFEMKAREAALLGSLGRRDDEIRIYADLVKERPKDARLWMSLGTALNYAGQREVAVKALRKATRLEPTYGEPWWSLANLKSFRFDDKDVKSMHWALRQSLAPIDALHFHFALGRAFELRGQHEISFDHYASGNRLRAATLLSHDTRVTAFVDAAIATFTPELFERNKGSGSETDTPIFVIGLQRSGSTLIEQILASHAQVEATAELMTMQHLWDELGGFERIASLDPSVFNQIGEEYLARTRAFRHSNKPRFVDKLPANWMNVGLIRLVLPYARIIDARRHPLACGWSNFKQHYATGVTFTYSLESIGVFYRDYLRLMQHFDRVQPGKILHVIHEDLVDNPEQQIRRILDFAGLPFDPACLEFHKTKRAVHTPSAEQVRRPISRDGLNSWRPYEPWLGPLKAALGQALAGWHD
jgi:Flp pilus assembly protein TadD